MSYFSFPMYRDILEKADYSVSPDELKELTQRLSKFSDDNLCLSINKILNVLKDELIVEGYDASTLDDYENGFILDIYLGFSGLKFTINNNHRLVLTEEMWYDRGCASAGHNIIIGDPTIENIIKVIDIYQSKGRGHSKINPYMSELLNNIHL